MASWITATRSRGVPGGRMNGEPVSLKPLCRATNWRSRSVLAKVSSSGRWLNRGCFSPLGISRTTLEVHEALIDPFGVLLQNGMALVKSSVYFPAQQSRVNLGARVTRDVPRLL